MSISDEKNSKCVSLSSTHSSNMSISDEENPKCVSLSSKHSSNEERIPSIRRETYYRNSYKINENNKCIGVSLLGILGISLCIMICISGIKETTFNNNKIDYEYEIYVSRIVNTTCNDQYIGYISKSDSYIFFIKTLAINNFHSTLNVSTIDIIRSEKCLKSQDIKEINYRNCIELYHNYTCKYNLDNPYKSLKNIENKKSKDISNIYVYIIFTILLTILNILLAICLILSITNYMYLRYNIGCFNRIRHSKTTPNFILMRKGRVCCACNILSFLHTSTGNRIFKEKYLCCRNIDFPDNDENYYYYKYGCCFSIDPRPLNEEYSYY